MGICKFQFCCLYRVRWAVIFIGSPYTWLWANPREALNNSNHNQPPLSGCHIATKLHPYCHLWRWCKWRRYISTTIFKVENSFLLTLNYFWIYNTFYGTIISTILFTIVETWLFYDCPSHVETVVQKNTVVLILPINRWVNRDWVVEATDFGF